MAAALPHVDQFVSGHSLAALERLAAIVAGARDPDSSGRSRPVVPPRRLAHA
jgi:hypothetical protein